MAILDIGRDHENKITVMKGSVIHSRCLLCYNEIGLAEILKRRKNIR